MKSLDQWLAEAIDRYGRLASYSDQLARHIQTLSLADISDQCTRLEALWREIVEREEKLHQLLSFVGSDALDNPLLGSYQRALTGAITATDRVAVTARRRKTMLLEQVEEAAQNGTAC